MSLLDRFDWGTGVVELVDDNKPDEQVPNYTAGFDPEAPERRKKERERLRKQREDRK